MIFYPAGPVLKFLWHCLSNQRVVVWAPSRTWASVVTEQHTVSPAEKMKQFLTTVPMPLCPIMKATCAIYNLSRPQQGLSEAFALHMNPVWAVACDIPRLSFLGSMYLQSKRMTSKPHHNYHFKLLINPNMPLGSSLVLQVHSLFPSVVRLGKSRCLRWRAVNHELEFSGNIRSLLFPSHVLNNQMRSGSSPNGTPYSWLVPSGMWLREEGQFQMQRNRVTDFFFPFCPGLQESPEGWMTTQVEQAWAEAPSCTAESSKSGLDPVFSG